MLGTDRSYYDIKNSLEEYVNGNDNSITNYLGFKDAFCKIRKDVLRNYLYENFDNFFKPSSSRAA